MKINIDMDISPEEARKLMGLPDVEPMQREIMDKIQAKMSQSLEDIQNPEFLLKQFMPVGMEGLEQMQKFMAGMAGAAVKAASPKPKGGDKN